MQAGKTKQVREETRGRRAELRPAARVARAVARLEQKRLVNAVQINEDRKRAAAQPSAIAEVKAAYKAQCAARRAEKATAKAERKANATTPAEAASNASAN